MSDPNADPESSASGRQHVPRRRPTRKPSRPPVSASDSLSEQPDDSVDPFSPMAEPREGYTGVGRVLRPHAIHGELRVFSFNPSAANMQAGRWVYIAGQRRRIQRARHDKEAWILQLSGLGHRNAAEELRDHLVEVKDAEILRDDAESYFVHELVGLMVRTVEGREVGRISEVLTTGANDVYVVKNVEKEYLIPAISDVVASIDLPVSVMTITPLAGLLDESE